MAEKQQPSENTEFQKFELTEEILRQTKVTETTPASLLPTQTSNKFEQTLAREINWTVPETHIGLSIILQKGGTSKNAQGNVYAVVNGKRLDLSTVKRVMREHGFSFTLRQWARTNATEIHKVNAYFGIIGDLAKKIGRNHELSNEEAIWCSNFQMDNEDAPARVRSLLMEHYKSLFQKD